MVKKSYNHYLLLRHRNVWKKCQHFTVRYSVNKRVKINNRLFTRALVGIGFTFTLYRHTDPFLLKTLIPSKFENNSKHFWYDPKTGHWQQKDRFYNPFRIFNCIFLQHERLTYNIPSTGKGKLFFDFQPNSNKNFFLFPTA